MKCLRVQFNPGGAVNKTIRGKVVVRNGKVGHKEFNNNGSWSV